MNIQPVPTPIVPEARASRTDGTGARGADRTPSIPMRATPVAAAPATPVRFSSYASSSRVEVQAPEGTDPKLWSILTTEERSYFARSTAQGPLTYARVMMGDVGTQGAPMSASMRGIRLDVRG